jgi:hypothetical protein
MPIVRRLKSTGRKRVALPHVNMHWRISNDNEEKDNAVTRSGTLDD